MPVERQQAAHICENASFEVSEQMNTSVSLKLSLVQVGISSGHL